MVTETEAREIVAAITLFQLKDSDASRDEAERLLVVAQGWFNALTQIIKNPTTRVQALANYQEIESLLKTVTDNSQRTVLHKELSNANEAYKTVKRSS